MVVELALFNRNVRDGGASQVDQHSCPPARLDSQECGRGQAADRARAIGVTCATIAEAELMSGGGIKHVLWTKQPASLNNISRAVALSKKDPTFMFVVDDPQVVDWVEQAAAARNAKLKIAVSVW